MNEKIPKIETQDTKDHTPTGEQILDCFETAANGLVLRQVGQPQQDTEGIRTWTVEVLLPDGRKMEMVYKRAQHLVSGENAPSRIHSVIYGGASTSSERGPEYHYLNGRWAEIKLEEDQRGKI